MKKIILIFLLLPLISFAQPNGKDTTYAKNINVTSSLKFNGNELGGVVDYTDVLFTVFYASDTSGTDSYKLVYSGITEYSVGMVVLFQANTANTGACGIIINNLVEKPCKVFHDQDPADNYIEVGSMVMAVYDGTNFQIISPNANP